MTENSSADAAQSRQAGFVRCCLYILSGCGDMLRPFFIFYMIARCTMNPSRLTDCIVF